MIINAYRNGQLLQTDVAVLSGVSLRGENYNINNNGYYFVVEEVNGKLQGILAQKEVANSMFTRLFFFEGEGLEGYEKLYSTTTFKGEKIIVYQKEW